MWPLRAKRQRRTAVYHLGMFHLDCHRQAKLLTGSEMSISRILGTQRPASYAPRKS
jgi:hypothetical protein